MTKYKAVSVNICRPLCDVELNMSSREQALSLFNDVLAIANEKRGHRLLCGSYIMYDDNIAASVYDIRVSLCYNYKYYGHFMEFLHSDTVDDICKIILGIVHD